jgi:serine/threonine protein phosphatase PrpC
MPQLEVAGQTHVGQVRPLNEDAWQASSESDTADLWTNRGRLFAVADGMGGHAAGEVASQLALDTLIQEYYGGDDTPLPPAIRLERAIIEANLNIYEQAVTVDAQSGMGTTIVAAIVYEDRVIVANVGDSRAYLVREAQVDQITVDHSWVAEQVKLGALSAEQAQNHAYRNLVTRCLGHRPGIQIDLFEHRLQPGDAILLCSDGLSNQVPQDEIARVVTEHSPDQAVNELIELANQRGGPDNITAVVIEVIEVPGGRLSAQRGEERPESLSAKTTQPIRLPRMPSSPARATRSVRGGESQGPSIPGRRRATILMIVIALVVLAAFALLIALRADKIVQGLGWPAPSRGPVPALPPVTITPVYHPSTIPTLTPGRPGPLPGGPNLSPQPSLP